MWSRTRFCTFFAVGGQNNLFVFGYTGRFSYTVLSLRGILSIEIKKLNSPPRRFCRLRDRSISIWNKNWLFTASGKFKLDKISQGNRRKYSDTIDGRLSNSPRGSKVKYTVFYTLKFPGISRVDRIMKIESRGSVWPRVLTCIFNTCVNRLYIHVNMSLFGIRKACWKSPVSFERTTH